MRTYTCIVCPNGCEAEVETKGDEVLIDGKICARGREYVFQEVRDPRRTFSSLVRVRGGEREVVAVRLTGAVPRDRIGEAMGVIRGLEAEAPVEAGRVLEEDLLGLGVRVVAVDGVAKE